MPRTARRCKPLEVTLFNPSYDKDKFESTAWTVNGKFGDLKAVYTGGYLVRNVEQVGDYTNYARGVYADYYQCYGPTAYDPNLKSTCFSPSATWHSVERNTHQQHELRLSTPDEWRLRAIAGAFYEDNTLYDQTGWQYKTVPSCTSNGASGTPGNSGCFANVGTFPGTTVANPGVQGDNTSFYQDTVRETKQTAFFASVDFDLIPKVLTATLGTRHFRFENSSAGSVLSSFLCFEGGVPPGGCQSADSYNLNAENLRDTESGFKSRGNLTWHITPDIMVYYTFSQGFRPGGFNQNGGSLHGLGPDGVAQYAVPKSYSSDKLTNNEIGWKTELFNHRLQWNGAIYQENWDNVQISFFDPGLVGNIFYDTNGQNFRDQGCRDLAGGPGHQRADAAGCGILEPEHADEFAGADRQQPGERELRQADHASLRRTGSGCVPATNPFGPIGAPSANAPPIQFSLRARYEWSIAGYTPFVQFDTTHSGHSYTQAGSNPTFAQAGLSTSRLRFENPAYSTYDASFGFAKDNWTVTVYGENLSDSNASTFISTDQFIVAQTPLRPRIIGASFAYKL